MIITNFCYSKEKVLKLELPKKNPTEYVYNYSIESLHKIIVLHNFNKLMLIDTEEKNLAPTIVEDLFSESKNKFDIFLWSIGVYCKSKIYFNKKGLFYDYIVSFYLHLEKIDENCTKISIKTIEPEIIIGKEFFPSPPHFVRKSKKIDVEPSSIEEYEILLEIGDLLKIKDMPQIILP